MVVRRTFKHSVLWFLLCLLGVLPRWLLHATAAVFAFILYHVLRYRRRVVCTNLMRAYEGKTEKERRKLAHRFYRCFALQMLSLGKLAVLSPEKAKQRISFGNLDVLVDLRKKGAKVVCLLMGHYGDWEAFVATPLHISALGYELHQIYRPLKSKTADDLMLRLRGQHGGASIAKDIAGRRLVQLANRDEAAPTALVIFIADQTPSRHNVHLWTNFLRQPTAFFTGAERLASRLDLPVVYLDVKPCGDDNYKGDVILMAEQPRSLEPLELTRRYARLMEQTIDRDPARWLWSHRRWKFTPEEVEAPFLP